MTSFERISGLIPQISNDLEKVNGDYCIIGSGALVLSGMDIPVNDLDILTSKAGAIILKKAWLGKEAKDYRPEQPERFRSEFGRFEFAMPVEVMGDLEVFNSGKWERVVVEKTQVMMLNGFEVRIPTLDELRKVLLQLGRPKDLEKANLI